MARKLTVLLAALVATTPALASRSAGAAVVEPVLVEQEVPDAGHGEEAGPARDAREDHAAPADEHVADDGHATDDGHGEEWGPVVMVHHVIDSHEIEFFAWTLHLPRWKPLRFGSIEIDMSPTKHAVFLMLSAILTILTVSIAASRFSRPDQGDRAPRGFLNVFETFYEYLRDEVVLTSIGHGGERFVPYVVTLFFFILYSNLMGLVPYGATATSNIMVTAALAFLSLIMIEVAGLQALGIRGYLGTIFYVPKGLPAWMVPVMLLIMTPVELIGKLAKPFALAIRLFANMTAGHFVLLATLGLILTYGAASTIGVVSITGALGLGLFTMFLELFVALLQAYIFAMLTAVFIGLIRHAH